MGVRQRADWSKAHPDLPVFDRARRPAGRNDPTYTLTNAGSLFHRTAVDRREPRSNVTAQILGDPAPGRSALERRA